LTRSTCQVSVTEMQDYIRDLQPKLSVAQTETGEMLLKIETMTLEANKVRDVVQAKEKATAVQARDAQAIKDECERELSVALPALDNAMKALNTLSKSDITEVKSMAKPPPGVILTMEAVCIMLDVAPDSVGGVCVCRCGSVRC
jgi:dynein heavy chain